MLKKISLHLAVVCFLSAISAFSGYAVKFDPETSEVSKRSTLETWVAPQHHQYFEKIQKNVAMTVRENPFSANFIISVVNAPGITQYFGKTFPTIPFEVAFLRHVRSISDTKKPVTLELAAAMGFVSCKVSLCFGQEGGTHYVNDINFSTMEPSYDAFIEEWLKETPALKEMLVKLPGSCFDIPQTHPHLLGTVDAIYVQNLDHFFNPADHQRYMRILTDLLAPGGRAFLCAHSFLFKKDDPLYKLYLQRKKEGDPYPGFVKHDVEFTVPVKYGFDVGEAVLSNATRPADNAFFEKFDIQSPEDVGSVYHPQMGLLELKKYRQRVTRNAFSPAIYKNLVATIPEITLIDTFFITEEGKRAEKWDKKITYAAVIFEKK